jgi:hypothetical protein
LTTLGQITADVQKPQILDPVLPAL